MMNISDINCRDRKQPSEKEEAAFSILFYFLYFIDDGRKVLYDAKDELLENYLLVKGERRAVTPQIAKELIGITDNAYGFEAVLPSDRAELLTKEFLFEKPTIDEIVVHYIKARNEV